MFGVNHKFAVNADQYDINNPNRYQLLSSSASSHIILAGGNRESGYQTTVPQPFNLSSNEQFGQIRRNRMQAELKEKEMGECTFKPETNAGRNKDIVNQIMMNYDDQGAFNNGGYYNPNE